MATDERFPADPFSPHPHCERLLTSFLEKTVARWPSAIAIEVPPGLNRPQRTQLTYADLWALSTALAAQLSELVTRECVVCILLPRDSALLAIAQIATLRCGAAYTCIDPASSTARIDEIVGDADAVAILTDPAGLVRYQHHPLGGARLIDVSAVMSAATNDEGQFTPPAWLTPSHLAYLIYTSGTTGRPKGVMIEHRSISNLVHSDLTEFGLGVGDRVVQGSSAAYDSSVEETWLAFASGATLVVMDEETARLGPDLVSWLRTERITVFCPPPTLLRATGCDDPAAALPDLKLLYVGGEALPPEIASRWSKGRRLVNGYGPTECTVTSVRGDITRDGPITIGSPVPGLTAWVLDESLNEVAQDQTGELLLGGVGLARGYWKQPDLTAEKFIAHPTLGRLYRTGDLVHRDSGGRYFYHGRIDAQVKLRGHRIELTGIEAILAECAGVRMAACTIQTDHGTPTLIAYVVPTDFNSPPHFAELKSALATRLPAHMVPSRIGVLAELPTSIGGKLNRAALPPLAPIEAGAQGGSGLFTPPRDSAESLIELAVRDTLRIPSVVSIHDDFFYDLGGDSLSVALLITQLRAEEATAWVTVRDVYEARTIAALSKRRPTATVATDFHQQATSRSPRWPFWVTTAQAAWLVLVFSTVSAASYAVSFELLPALANNIGLVASILLAPFLALVGFFLYTPLSIALAVATKKVLIGRYQPVRAPVWGKYYLRHWTVQQTARLIPWRVLEGTEFQNVALRALGAQIGERVHIHRGVNLIDGGWDLLRIGDNVTLNQSASLRLVELVGGDIVIAPITLENNVTLDIRASVGGDCAIEQGAFITALSSVPNGTCVPRNEKWDGIPARPVGSAPPRAEPVARAGLWSPYAHGVLMCGASALMSLALLLPLELLTISLCVAYGVSVSDVWGWLDATTLDWTTLTMGFVIVVVSVPLTLVFAAALVRMLGRIPTGSIDRWGIDYIRVWLKTSVVESAGRWLSGTILWPLWLRATGMRVDDGCEISTIIDVIPEHVTIGRQSFFADGIYLGGPAIHQGVVTLAHTRLGSNTFLGNHVVIPAGSELPADILLGVCTVADDTAIQRSTAWFGHPPFELPRREVVEIDRQLTHEPTVMRYASRLFWELLRFALPITPLLVFYAWVKVLAGTEATSLVPWFVAVPAASFVAAGLLCLLIIAMKWLLLGRVRPGQHALWSCWASRWDFLFVAWGQYAAPVLGRLEGTLLLNWYLRAIGMRIGARVALGPGFSQVVDPDMITIEDDATVSASYQAHTFEDRVLKLDHVVVRRGATLGAHVVPLYGADIGANTIVAPHSVIMKHERLLPSRSYEGAPTRAWASDSNTR